MTTGFALLKITFVIFSIRKDLSPIAVRVILLEITLILGPVRPKHHSHSIFHVRVFRQPRVNSGYKSLPFSFINSTILAFNKSVIVYPLRTLEIMRLHLSGRRIKNLRGMRESLDLSGIERPDSLSQHPRLSPFVILFIGC